MRILIAGTGAVGAYFGGRLARAGLDVVFLARGRNLAALRQHGLTIESVDGDARLPHVTATDTLVGYPPVGVAIVTVKSYDTAAIGAAIAPVITPETIVLSLQNGIENEDVLARALGLPPLMVALTRIGVALVAPATIDYSGRGTILFGEPDGSESPRAQRVAEALAAAGVPYELRRDILVAAWEKLAWNAGFNAVTTLTRSTVAEVLAQYADSSGRDLSDLGFYIALASFKAAVILEGIHFRYVHGQTVGEGFQEIGTMVEPLVASGLAAIRKDS